MRREPFVRKHAVGIGLAVGALSAALLVPISAAAGAASPATKKPERTTDFHVLAWNDFHGNLEAGTNNIYG